MAAEKLDKLWDSSLKSLSEGYRETLSLLEQGKTGEAGPRFKKDFVTVMKRLYSEAAEIYPVRFDKKIEEWCVWTKALYKLTLGIDKAFDKEDVKRAQELLPEIRKQFYDLHREAGLRKVNDYVYIFLMMLDQEKAKTEHLKAVLESLDKADLSVKAKANADEYNQAKASWLERTGPILEGDSLGADQREQLREATESFFQAFGVQFQ